MKTFKRFVAFGLTLSIIMCSTAAPTFASESTQGRASNSTEVHDFLVSGLAAAEAVSEFEDTTKTKFSVEDFSNLNITDDWEADAEAFLNDYLASRSIYRIETLAQDEELQEAKATSIAYSIDCAEWSIEQNRAKDIAKEAGYMFISHYVDRKDYFWNQGKAALLLDGEQRSGPDGALARWLTASDRQAYDTYMSSTKVSSSIQKVGSLASGISSLKGNYETLTEGYEHFVLTRNVFSTALAELLNGFDASLNKEDLCEDSKWMVNQIISKCSENPNVRLNVLVQQYMEDDTILLNYGEVDKEKLIQNSAVVVCSYILGGCAGVAGSVLGTLTSTMISFTIETYTDFFNYVAWLSLQYGYSGRYALRFSDYAGI